MFSAFYTVQEIKVLNTEATCLFEFGLKISHLFAN